MKRHGNPNGLSELILTLFLLSSMLFFPFKSNAYVIGDVDGDGKISLTEAIHALQVISEGRSPLTSKTINVPGDVPTIQQAIDAAAEGDTIKVAAGSYNEALLIEKNRITLQGAGKESTIIDGGGQTVITLSGVQNIAVQSLTIKNGYNGIYVKPGALIEIKDVDVFDNTNNGIVIDENSTATLFNCLVSRSNGTGIVVGGGSSATFGGSVSSNNNGQDGIMVVMSSFGYFVDAIITTNDNQRRGLNLVGASSINARNSNITAQRNVSIGLAVVGSSWMEVKAGNTLVVSNNTGIGFFLTDNASVYATCTVTIENNGDRGIFANDSATINIAAPAQVYVAGNKSPVNGHGIHLHNGSHLYVPSGSLVVENNARHGIFVQGSTALFGVQESSASVTIRNNKGSGLVAGRLANLLAFDMIVQANTLWGVLGDNSTLHLEKSRISDNVLGDVDLRFGSRATLNNNTIGSITCEDSVLSRGTHVCP